MRWTKAMGTAAAAVGLAALAAPAAAGAPGLGDPVYGATVTQGLTEFETRFGRLTGGPADGADGLVFEVEHGFTPRLSVALLVETGRSDGERRAVNSFGVEVVRSLGRLAGIDTAIYVEAKRGLGGEPDAVEVKGLFERTRGRFDARLNLIGEKPLQDLPLAFGYAASADWAVIGDEFRLGAAAFGDLGSATRFAGRQQHFVGPQAKVEIERIGPGEFEIEAGWLAAVGTAARETTRGQARLLVSYEAKF